MKLHRNEKFFKWGLTAFLTFIACALFWIVFSNLTGFYDAILKFFSIISPLLFGCVFAYLMNPIMEWVKKPVGKLVEKQKWTDKVKGRVITTASVSVSVLVFLAVIYAFFAIVIPSLISSLEDLLQPAKLQGYYITASTWINDFLTDMGLEDWLYDNTQDILQVLFDALAKIDVAALVSRIYNSAYGVVAGVINAVIGIIAAIYILIYKKQLCSQAKKITVSVFNTAHANRIFEVSRRTNRIFGGYVIGKILDALIVGVITYIVMLIMGMPYASLIAVIIGVTNIIPFFGPFIGAVPSAFLLLIDKPINALYFIIFILVLQMIDGYIIENRILGEKLGISDLWVLAAILIFGGIFGFGGMLLGVPIFAVIYFLISDAVNRRLARKRYPLSTEEYYTLRCVEDLPVDPVPSYSFVSVEPSYDMNAEPEEDEIEEDD